MANYEIKLAQPAFEFDTENYRFGKTFLIDSTHAYVGYGRAQTVAGEVLAIDGSYNVTTSVDVFLIDTATGSSSSAHTCIQIDSNHFLHLFRDDTATTSNTAQVVEVNTTTWSISTVGTGYSFLGIFTAPSVCAIDVNHFIATWTGVDSDGFTQVFIVDTTTWNVSTGAVFEFDTDNCALSVVKPIDANHFMVAYAGNSNDGFARTLVVNTSTWAVTTVGSAVEFDTGDFYGGDIVEIDSGFFVCSWWGSAGYRLKAQTLIVDTSTWNISTRGKKDFEITYRTNTAQGQIPQMVKIDTNNILIVYGAVNISEAFAFSVNTSNYEITTAGYCFTFAGGITSPIGHSVVMIDSTHFLCTVASSGNDGYANVLEIETKTNLYDIAAPYYITQKSTYTDVFSGTRESQFAVQKVDTTHAVVFYVETSTFNGIAQSIVIDTDSGVIATVGSPITFYTSGTSLKVQKAILMDENHIVVAWQDKDNDGWVQSFVINTTTWDVTTAGSSLEYEPTQANGTVGNKIDDTHFILFWLPSSSTGYIQTFAVDTSTWAVTTAASIRSISYCYSGLGLQAIDSNHFLLSWQAGYAQVAEVNTSTWAVAMMDTKTLFDASCYGLNSISTIDSNHFLNVYIGASSVLYTVGLTVNTSTWAVSTYGIIQQIPYYGDFSYSYWNQIFSINSTYSVQMTLMNDSTPCFITAQHNTTTSSNVCIPPFRMANTLSAFPQAFMIDTTNVFACWVGYDGVFRGNVYDLNYSAPSSIMTVSGFDITTACDTALVGSNVKDAALCMIDENHGVIMGQGKDSDGYIRVFEINTTTYAVTTKTAIEFDTYYASGCSVIAIDSNHVIGFYGGRAGKYGIAQTYTINTSTWTMTANTRFEYNSKESYFAHHSFCVDSTHFIDFYTEYWAGFAIGCAMVFAVNTSTWAITSSSDVISFAQRGYDASNGSNVIALDSNHFFVIYGENQGNEYQTVAGQFCGRVIEVNTTNYQISVLPQTIILEKGGMKNPTITLLSDTRFVITYADKLNTGFSQGYVVNTSTWEISTCGDKYITNSIQERNFSVMMDSTHFVNFYSSNSYPSAQSYSVSTDGKIIKKSGSGLEILTSTQNDCSGVAKVDSSHIIANFYYTTDAVLQVFAVDVTPPRLPDYRIATAASLTFDTGTNQYNSCVAIDSEHYVNFWAGTDNDGFVQAFAVNTSTWAVTTAGASLEFDTGNGTYNKCCLVDANHIINFWANPTKGGAQMFAVDTSTWAVTTAGALLEFVASTGAVAHNACFLVDSNHVINFWQENSATGYAQIFAVDTSTWAVSTAGAALAYEAAGAEPMYNACYSIDATHYINFWRDTNNDGFAQVFIVNTSTWAISTATGVKKWEDTKATYTTVCAIDSNHYLVFWAGADDDGMAQVIAVDTSTWAVTTASAVFEFDTANGMHNSCVQINSTRYVNFWSGNGDDGYVQVFDVSTSSWEITTASPLLEFEPTLNGYNSCALIDTQHVINFFAGTDNKGYSQVFSFNDLYYCTPNVESVGIQQIITKGSDRTYDESLTTETNIVSLQGKNFLEGVNMSLVFEKIATALREFVESIGVALDFVKALPKEFVENVGVVVVYLGNLSKLFLESVGVILSYLKEIPKEFVEGVNVVESFLKTMVQEFVLAVGVAEVWVQQLLKTFVENVQITVQNTWESIREFVENVGIQEVFSKIVVVLKNFVENVQLLGDIFQKTMSVIKNESVVMAVDEIRLIWNGYLVGVWRKIVFAIGGTWTKK